MKNNFLNSRLQRELVERQQKTPTKPDDLLGATAGRPGAGLREDPLPGRLCQGGAGHASLAVRSSSTGI